MTTTPRTIKPSPLDRNIRRETIKLIDSAKKEVVIIGDVCSLFKLKKLK